MSWLACLLMVGGALSAPPSEEASSNQPAAIDDRPRWIEKTDVEVIPASQVPVPIPAKIPEAEPSDLTKPVDGRKPVVITPPTKGSEKPRRRLVGQEIGATDLPRSRSLAWWTTTGIGLAAVLLAIYFAGRLMKRALPGATVGSSSGPVQVLDRTFLSPKHTICLVGCGDRILVVGMCGERMQTLSEIHDPQEIDFIRGQLMQTRPRSTTEAFRQLLSGRAQLAEVKADELASKEEGESSDERTAPKREFYDHLSSLRDQIARFKTRSRPT